MDKVECSSCNYKVKKPTLETLIHTVKKSNGNVFLDICPDCKNNTLKLKSYEEEVGK